MTKQEITLNFETIQTILEKLQILKEIEENELTDWDTFQTTEDRLSIAESYIECSTLINYLKDELNGE